MNTLRQSASVQRNTTWAETAYEACPGGEHL